MKERLKEDRLISESELDRIINEKLLKLNLKEEEKEPVIKENIHTIHKPIHPLKPVPIEHKRNVKENLKIEEDFDTLLNIFEDESTTNAVIKTIKESPLEIQIITKIVLSLYEKLDYTLGE